MTTRITEVVGDDGETIYIQYDDEEIDTLQAVSSWDFSLIHKTLLSL